MTSLRCSSPVTVVTSWTTVCACERAPLSHGTNCCSGCDHSNRRRTPQRSHGKQQESNSHPDTLFGYLLPSVTSLRCSSPVTMASRPYFSSVGERRQVKREEGGGNAKPLPINSLISSATFCSLSWEWLMMTTFSPCLASWKWSNPQSIHWTATWWCNAHPQCIAPSYTLRCSRHNWNGRSGMETRESDQQ